MFNRNFNQGSMPVFNSGAPNQMSAPLQNFNAQPAQNYNQMPIRYQTNKAFAVSLEDALNKPTQNCTDILYVDQNKDFVYNIVTDEYGCKRALKFKLIEVVDEVNNDEKYVTRDEYKKMFDQLESLKQLLQTNVDGGNADAK